MNEMNEMNKYMENKVLGIIELNSKLNEKESVWKTWKQSFWSLIWP